MEEQTKVDKDYIEAFNQGYMLSKELGLKPNILEQLSSGNHRMEAMQDGMQQYQEDRLLELSKAQDKEIIPPLDIDSMDNRYMDLDIDNSIDDKEIDMGLE
ncbi:MAG: hypothetical protein AAFX55_20085 [Bacteroidota bacterium]